jgi:hypothetical protein
MTDDGFKLEVDGALAERLKLAAAAAGESVQHYALQALRSAADDDWAEERARFAKYERTGEYIDAEIWVQEFRGKLRQRLREKRK